VPWRLQCVVERRGFFHRTRPLFVFTAIPDQVTETRLDERSPVWPIILQKNSSALPVKYPAGAKSTHPGGVHCRHTCPQSQVQGARLVRRSTGAQARRPGNGLGRVSRRRRGRSGRAFKSVFHHPAPSPPLPLPFFFFLTPHTFFFPGNRPRGVHLPNIRKSRSGQVVHLRVLCGLA